MSIKIDYITKGSLDQNFLSQQFTEFYKDEPWNEYLRCPKCGDPEKFDTRGTYGYKEVLKKKIKNCPVCSSPLGLFWSPERTIYYLEKAMGMPGFVGLVASKKKNVCGWIWGYRINPKIVGVDIRTARCFYIDVICILEEYRNSHPLVAGELYVHLLNEIIRQGYSCVATRTHKKAYRVRSMLKLVGFVETGISAIEDNNRDYWIKFITK